MIQRNPFLSQRFATIWSKHFAPTQKTEQFTLLAPLKFIKHRFLPLFTNVGKMITKGIGYTTESEFLDDTEVGKTSKKTFLIYDVPTYFEVPVETPDNPLNLHRSKQYPGFLIELTKFKDLNEYLQVSFSKSSRYKLKKYKKRFEASFDVRYVMYHGAMSRNQYDIVFDRFHTLLEKRFDEKQITNNNLDPREWGFYREVTYPMLLQNEASLFVIYHGDEPIGVTLNFFSEDILFDAITVFDIDYAKFHLGSVTIMGLLDWCFENGLRIFDFSKGYFDYKARWATRVYDFEYHILYDSKSLRAKTMAYFLVQFFDFKQWLRDKKVNEHLHRMTYKFRNKTTEPLETRGFSFLELKEDESLAATLESLASGQTMNEASHSALPESVTMNDALNDESKRFPIGTDFEASPEIDLESSENHLVKLMVFEYLYLNDGHYRDIKVYKVPQKTDQYYIASKTKTVLATLE